MGVPRWLRSTPLAAILSAAVLATSAGLVAAVITPNAGPFTGCLSTRGGVLYNLAVGTSPGNSCKAADQIVSFSNAQGPQGPQGETGDDAGLLRARHEFTFTEIGPGLLESQTRLEPGAQLTGIAARLQVTSFPERWCDYANVDVRINGTDTNMTQWVDLRPGSVGVDLEPVWIGGPPTLVPFEADPTESMLTVSAQCFLEGENGNPDILVEGQPAVEGYIEFLWDRAPVPFD